MTRYTVLVHAGTVVPAGTCPACDSVMDDSGCRLGPWDRYLRPEAEARTGISRIVEVFCATKTPPHPVRPCPACEKAAAR